MANFDFKSTTPDTSFPAGAFLFGADSQSAATPSIYAQSTVWDYWKTLANTWSAASTASAPAAYYTGDIYAAGTGTTNFPHIFVQPTGATASTTWSTAGTIYGANAASGFAGNLIDVKVAGVSVARVTAANAFLLGVTNGVGLYSPGTQTDGSAQMYVATAAGPTNAGGFLCAVGFGFGNNGGNGGFYTSGTQWSGRSDMTIRWSNTTAAVTSSTYDLFLARDAANTLALRNSTNAQTERVYTTWTNASNGEWLEIGSASSIPYISATKNGTGTQRAINLQRVATPASGSSSAAVLLGTTAAFGIYYGSGAPTVTAAQGSIYLRSDGSGIADRLYVNTDGGTTWTTFTSAA